MMHYLTEIHVSIGLGPRSAFMYAKIELGMTSVNKYPWYTAMIA
jgi:hypothetical protein